VDTPHAPATFFSAIGADFEPNALPMTTWDDAEALFTHLSRLGAGMESQILGETQVFSQLKRAYSEANGFLKGPLRRLVETSFCLAKRIRRDSGIQADTLSLPKLAFEAAEEHFSHDLADKRFVIVGAGELGALCASYFQKKVGELTVINRTYERAQALCDRFSATAAPWERLNDEIATADCVLCAIHAPRPMIHQNHSATTFFIDLSMPYAVAPNIPNVLRLETLTQRQEAHRKRRESALRIAETICRTGVREYVKSEFVRSRLKHMFVGTEHLRRTMIAAESQSPQHDVLDAFSKKLCARLMFECARAMRRPER
jgi:glutamyl-tRNA reductase